MGATSSPSGGGTGSRSPVTPRTARTRDGSGGSADGRNAQPITGAPPPDYARGGYYGFDPIEWTPNERTLLAGLASEWGAEAIRVDVTTGAFRKLSGYALDLSRDGRVALVNSGGSEGPQTIATVTLADGHRHVLAHGDVAFPSWNR
jgi:hypothetical protein